MKSLPDHRIVWIVCVGSLLLFPGIPAHGWQDHAPMTYVVVRFSQEFPEMAPWVIRGQDDPPPPDLVSFDVVAREPWDLFGRPVLVSDLDMAFAVDARWTSASSMQSATVRPMGITDIAQALQESSTVQTTSVRRRSPVAQSAYVRGYALNQIYNVADGVPWTSARADLDADINRVDPSLVDQVVVLPGPYGLRYGPGFAFIDLSISETPRFEGGFQAHNRMAWTFRFNQGQIYGTDTIYGGSDSYGFTVTYGHRVGSDYRAGDGLRIPSGYNVGNLMGQVGFDLSDDTSLEFRYQYLNQWDTDYAAQFFDINSLVANAFSLTYQKGRSEDKARLEATGWYHETRFSGDTMGSGKRRPDFPVLQRVDQALASQGFTDFFGVTTGASMSTGARGAVILEPIEDIELRVGTDFRLMDQTITEDYTLREDGGEADIFRTRLPKASLVNPGLYGEARLDWTPDWTTKLGGRFDWAYTTARGRELDDPLVPGNSLGDDLHRGEPLFATYLTNSLDVTPHWTTQIGVGYGEVVPDLFQRYANGVFLGIIQSGFSRIVGSPSLPKQRLLQLDVEAQAEYDRFRGRAAFFHGWLFDYATYAANIVPDPSGARLLQATSTDRASMIGFELYGEYDLFDYVTPFGSARYVQGKDRVINEPLAQIPPLEGKAGIKFENIQASRPWGLEGGVRMVARQDRFASVRSVLGSDVVPIEMATPGFSTTYLRAHYSPRQNLSFIAGVENLFDRRYIEHLDLRLPAESAGDPLLQEATEVLSPGVTPFIGIEWTL